MFALVDTPPSGVMPDRADRKIRATPLRKPNSAKADATKADATTVDATKVDPIALLSRLYRLNNLLKTRTTSIFLFCDRKLLSSLVLDLNR